MTENIPQTSASDRIEAARTALNAYTEAASHNIDPDEADDMTEERERVAARDMADKLIALITPPSVGESDEQIAINLADEWTDNGMLHDEDYRLALAAVRAGIQDAHNTWEPADRPSQEQMLRWLGIEHYEGSEDRWIHLTAQAIEKEEI